MLVCAETCIVKYVPPKAGTLVSPGLPGIPGSNNRNGRISGGRLVGQSDSMAATSISTVATFDVSGVPKLSISLVMLPANYWKRKLT